MTKILIKYDLGDQVFVLYGEKIHKGKVTKYTVVKYIDMHRNYGSYIQYEIEIDFETTGKFYENKVFSTMDALLQDLAEYAVTGDDDE